MDARLDGCDTDYRGHRALHKLGLDNTLSPCT